MLSCMKKNISKLIVISLVLLTILTPTSYAEVNNKITVYEAEEISNIDVLKQRAHENISEDELDTQFNSKISIHSQDKFTDNNVIFNTEDDLGIESTYSTTQKIRSTLIGDSLKNEYVKYVFINLETNEPVSTRGSGSGGETEEDGNTAVLYLKINYEYTTNVSLSGNRTATLFRFTSVKAKVTRDDSSINFSNLIVSNNKSGELYKDSQGTTLYSSRTDNNTKKVSNPSTNTYYSASDKNTYVAFGVMWGMATAHSEVTVTRGTSSWNLEVDITKDSI